jgi:hypothetical protein
VVVAAGQLLLCGDVPPVEAPEDWYREAAAFLQGEEDAAWNAIVTWARRQPGFEELWIDRANHDGWLTLAFSVDADLRQAELVEQFADTAVVAVPVAWTMSDLMVLQQQIGQFFTLQLQPQGMRGFATGIYPQKGVVSAEIGFLKPVWVAAINSRFAGQPVCIDGADPALAPQEGPQQPAGEGWRLLADQDETGKSYWTSIAFDDASYSALWDEARLRGDPPAVDFESEVVLWFGAVHGSSCPRLRLDGVTVAEERSLVHADITMLDAGGPCTADAIPHAYVVAFERARLPAGPFAIQLSVEDPPAGVPEERTVVHVDLKEPGSTAQPDQITRGGAIP